MDTVVVGKMGWFVRVVGLIGVEWAGLDGWISWVRVWVGGVEWLGWMVVECWVGVFEQFLGKLGYSGCGVARENFVGWMGLSHGVGWN